MTWIITEEWHNLVVDEYKKKIEEQQKEIERLKEALDIAHKEWAKESEETFKILEKLKAALLLDREILYKSKLVGLISLQEQFPDIFSIPESIYEDDCSGPFTSEPEE